MELSNLDFEPRERSAWQVFDLSILMVRRWGFTLFSLWFMQAVPVFVLLFLLLDADWAALVVWWLKPLFERPMLHYASQAAFGQRPAVLQCLAVLRRLGILNLLSILTWRRLSLKRAYLAPVDQLEGLRGSARAKRIQSLDNAAKHHQAFWQFLCLHIELIVVAGLAFLLFSLIPQSAQIDLNFQDIDDLTLELGIAYAILCLIAYGIVAPFYVVGGFLGYLHSRILLEAWDIEIAFKRMSKRLASLTPAVVAAMVVVGLSVGSSTVEAKVLEGVSPADVQTQVEEIFQQPEVIERVTTWELAESGDDAWQDVPEWLINTLKAIAKWFTETDFTALDTVFWMAIILLLMLAWWKFSRVRFSRLEGIERAQSPESTLPDFVRKVPVSQWPEDLIEAALQTGRAGDTRLSLTYLLRHFLLLAQTRFGVSLDASMTEGECEAQLQAQLPSALLPHYRTLLGYWIQQAWAHRAVSTEHIESLIHAFQDTQKQVNTL